MYKKYCTSKIDQCWQNKHRFLRPWQEMVFLKILGQNQDGRWLESKWAPTQQRKSQKKEKEAWVKFVPQNVSEKNSTRKTQICLPGLIYILQFGISAFSGNLLIPSSHRYVDIWSLGISRLSQTNILLKFPKSIIIKTYTSRCISVRLFTHFQSQVFCAILFQIWLNGIFSKLEKAFPAFCL